MVGALLLISYLGLRKIGQKSKDAPEISKEDHQLLEETSNLK